MNNQIENNNQMPNKLNSNNKNNKTLIIVLVIIGVVILALIIGIFAYSKINSKPTEEPVGGTIVDPVEPDEPEEPEEPVEPEEPSNPEESDNIFHLNEEISRSQVAQSNYESSIQDFCNSNFDFNINNGILTITKKETNENYTLNSIKNIKEIEEVNHSYVCGLGTYYLLTNDGKIYYSKGMLESMTDINNYFVLLKTNENYTYTAIGNAVVTYDGEPDANVGLIAKTTTGDELIFLDPSYTNKTYYKVK